MNSSAISLKESTFLSCFVAEDSITSRQLGFQGLSLHPELPEGWADIGTFTRIEFKASGIGTALFIQTKSWASEHNLASINAAIRADNQRGLAYYEKIGFQNYKVVKGVPLRNGTPVDRIFKRYLLRGS